MVFRPRWVFKLCLSSPKIYTETIYFTKVLKFQIFEGKTSVNAKFRTEKPSDKTLSEIFRC